MEIAEIELGYIALDGHAGAADDGAERCGHVGFLGILDILDGAVELSGSDGVGEGILSLFKTFLCGVELILRALYRDLLIGDKVGFFLSRIGLFRLSLGLFFCGLICGGVLCMCVSRACFGILALGSSLRLGRSLGGFYGNDTFIKFELLLLVFERGLAYGHGQLLFLYGELEQSCVVPENFVALFDLAALLDKYLVDLFVGACKYLLLGALDNGTVVGGGGPHAAHVELRYALYVGSA